MSRIAPFSNRWQRDMSRITPLSNGWQRDMSRIAPLSDCWGRDMSCIAPLSNGSYPLQDDFNKGDRLLSSFLSRCTYVKRQFYRAIANS